MPKINGVWYDEQEMQDKLHALCGGRQKAAELQRIWGRSYPHPGYGIKTKEDDFRKQGKEAGFTSETIEYFIIC